jgi:hypothetical protein
VSKMNGSGSRLEITIDMTDWEEKALRTEDPPQDEEDLLRLVKKFGTREAGQMTVVWIERGQSPRELLPTCKCLLSDGAQLNISNTVKGLEAIFKVANREYRVRRTMAVVSENDDEETEEGTPQLSFEAEAEIPPIVPPHMPEKGWVDAGTPESRENARRYLTKIVPGHVRPRLEEIKVASGDPRAALQELVSILWAILAEIE